MYKLLIVEDDRGIAQAIKTQAETWETSKKVEFVGLSMMCYKIRKLRR